MLFSNETVIVLDSYTVLHPGPAFLSVSTTILDIYVARLELQCAVVYLQC